MVEKAMIALMSMMNREHIEDMMMVNVEMNNG
jgi:hypothetical protein